MSQIAASGGQPQKQPKYAPIYTGRFFNGINTNRSPLRAATADHRSEKYYSDSSGDALIAGANLEVSNRLTLVRRPGNPIYDQHHQYNNPDSFDDFRVNKAASDVFGTNLEQIYTMIDETTTASYRGHLYSLTDTFYRGDDTGLGYNYGLAFQKSVGSGQAYMQAVGNSLYFADGVDNKKWLTSLFVRTSSGNAQQLQGFDGLAGTYPFGTYLIDPATGNIQQFIGITIGDITNVSVTNNVMTLTTTTLANSYIAGTSFQLWGFAAGPNSWMNGLTITLNAVSGANTLQAPVNHADYSAAEAGTQYIIQAGTTPVIALTGSSVPTYGTVVPNSTNDFMGSLTLDGNTVWINRGPSVENWGIKPPTGVGNSLSFSVAGSAQAWQANTFFSSASIFQDANGNLWQVTKAGKTGATLPAWNATPTIRQKVVISNVAISAGVVTFITDTQTPALVAGDTVEIAVLDVAGTAANLNGAILTVLAGGLSTTGFTANYTFPSGYTTAEDYGLAIKTAGTGPPTMQPDGTVEWTSIQLLASLTWAAHTHYNVGDFIIAIIGGQPQYFQLGLKTRPFISPADVASDLTIDYLTGLASLQTIFKGAFPFWNAADPSIGSEATWASISPTTIPAKSLMMLVPASSNAISEGVLGSGEQNGVNTTFAANTNWDGVFVTKIFIPVAGQYTFSLEHNDGAFFSFDISTGAHKVSGSYTPQSGGGVHNITAKLGYGHTNGSDIVGNDNSTPGSTESATWYFPTAGAYGLEIDYANWSSQSGLGFMHFTCPGPLATQNIAIGRDVSGTTTPVFPGFTTSGATVNLTTNPPTINWPSNVIEVTSAAQQYQWNNIGLVSDFSWNASTNYTLPATLIIDSAGNQELILRSGLSGTTMPLFSATVNATTVDVLPLIFINGGSVAAITNAGNTITAVGNTQGWLYWIALVNTLDNTVSNLGPVSSPTGPVIKGQITFAPGSGLPLDLSAIDPQADYVAIFRSVNGFSTPLLIPGLVNSPWTVPLTQYLRNGYVDTTPDTQLNNLILGPQGLENTPPVQGAANLTYHLNRIWYSVGNTVYWTTGPLSPAGNGTDGTAPGNFAATPSTVKRLVPCAIGMLVFTLSDVYIIAGNGTSGNPILPAIPYLIGIGLGNYNALDVNGGLIGFFTTDKQFVIFDPSAGLNYAGFNIGDQFRQSNNQPGTSWVPSKVYVAWYVNGEDVGWYVADGANGWYRMIYTPAPESGSVAWSPFATIQGSCGAIKSVETSPGFHQLLIGQTHSAYPMGPGSNILARDLSASTDNGMMVTIAPSTPMTNYLGMAENFAILAASTVVGSAGAGSVISGNVGLYAGISVTNFPPSSVVAPGVMHITDAAALQAQTDLTAAMVYYSGLSFTALGSDNMSVNGNGVNSHTYTAGNYSGGALDIPTDITLDAQGNPNAIFVFKAASSLTLHSGANVLLANGARAGNVYWVVGSSATTIWNGIQSNMVGTIMAVSSVTLGGGVLQGRALASTAAVTLATTEIITVPTVGIIPGTTINTGLPYNAYGVIGSIVLAQPGQIAKVAYITTVCVKTGSPLILGVILNEALPYYKGSFDILKHWVNDPPNLPPSKSFYRQRFYLAEDEQTSAYCMDLQILVQFPAEAAQNELQALTIFGAYEVEA